ncbi:MAG TPA: hypothetical protein VH741_09745, partial [Candidatus Limnocylindrales bacterium]
PGSPSFALRHWAGSAVPRLIGERLAAGAAVTFASAAALTLGAFTLPVYEIYKAGAEPHWLPGLDVLGGLGIRAAVVPHYDNAEGGGHDTRFCFIGARRLALLERELPDDALILGVDEHTALVLDLAAGSARVEGRGGVTVRRHGDSTVHPAGTELPLDELRTARAAAEALSAPAGPRRAPGDVRSAALARQVVAAERQARSAAGRAAIVGPLVEMLLEGRRHARATGNYAMADDVRARLTALGIEINDAPDGSSSYELPD